MAKITMTVEEFLEVARGGMPTEEMKQQLAKGMLEAWHSPNTQALIESQAEHLAKVKVERTIRDAMTESKGRWNGHGYDRVYGGWAMPVIREVLMTHFSIPSVLEAIKPEIEGMVEELMAKGIAKLLTGNGVSSKNEGN